MLLAVCLVNPFVLVEIGEAREHERELVAQTVVARERAQLAREMHDMVSHWVSLIAVQAGALQTNAADRATGEAAATVRRLSVRTLDDATVQVLGDDTHLGVTITKGGGFRVHLRLDIRMPDVDGLTLLREIRPARFRPPELSRPVRNR
ncbi:histidine kinase [Nonomuraea lactucae]|uniref:histidine kinase n=1 Tax=Nonomuraea lactucae TaxID=2249762 RepID=UPI001F053E29|nr:histidine kinase dimerization/phosphoacceptor domain-containing protein [Nonomuraea lactucae]